MGKSAKEMYDIYCQGIESRNNGWEKNNRPNIDKMFDAFANFHQATNQSRDWAANHYLANYRGYSLEKPIRLDEDIFISVFNDLVKKYELDVLRFNPSYTDIRFTARAVISEKDPTTRTNFSKDLGIFRVSLATDYEMDYSPIIRKPTSKAAGVKNNSSINLGIYTCYHPHISAHGDLCLGSYVEQIGYDYANMKILSILFNLCELLQRYNANSLAFSGAYIHNWIGNKCEVCSLFIGQKEEIRCAGSTAPVHKDCCEKIGDKFYSLNFIKKCSKCGERAVSYIPYSFNNIVCSKCDGESK